MIINRSERIRRELTPALRSIDFLEVVESAPMGAAEKAALTWLRQFENDFEVTSVEIGFAVDGSIDSAKVRYSDGAGGADKDRAIKVLF